jgi:hypothetical protein
VFPETCAWFPLDFTSYIFFFASFSWHPAIKTNCRFEYNYILSSVSLSRELLNLVVVLGTFDTGTYYFMEFMSFEGINVNKVIRLNAKDRKAWV